ncbi:MAG: hypothetical protein R3C05_18775 [Pirellulaceae bacterium]
MHKLPGDQPTLAAIHGSSFAPEVPFKQQAFIKKHTQMPIANDCAISHPGIASRDGRIDRPGELFGPKPPNFNGLATSTGAHKQSAHHDLRLSARVDVAHHFVVARQWRDEE